MLLPSWLGPWVLTTIAGWILPDRDADFPVNHYLPALAKAAEGISISFSDKIVMVRRFLGMIIKILYAFFYQEQFLTPDFLTQPFWISLGGHSIWLVNMIADTISDLPQTDVGVQFGQGVYPGDSTCRYEQGHSIWHEMSANGLLEIVMLVDYVNYAIKKSNG